VGDSLGDDRDFLWRLPTIYAFEGRLSVIGLYQIRCVNIAGRFPSVIALRIALPFDQILQGPFAPIVPMIADLLYLILFLVIDHVRWWSGEVWSVCRGFAIGQ
jgi:hypothetical protein